MSKPPFQPAPRPRPRISPDQAVALAGTAADLGFTRASTAPEPAPATESPSGQVPKGASGPHEEAALKVMVPRSLMIQLRQKAAASGKTVRYHVLEALAAYGYEFDLSSIPEDGRRLR